MNGWIYVIGSFEHLEFVKVGMTLGRVEDRRLALQTGNPFNLHTWGSFPVPSRRLKKCEKEIHKALADLKIRSEWFRMHPKEAMLVASKIAKAHGEITRVASADRDLDLRAAQ